MSGERLYDEATLKSVLGYWALATTIGFLLGGIVAMSVEFASYDLDAQYSTVHGNWTIVGGLTLGSAVAVLLQGLVLRRHALWAARWVTFRGAGLVLGVVLGVVLLALSGELGMIIEQEVLPVNIFLLIGTCLGIAQGLALHGRVPRAWLWVLVSGIAWLASILVGGLGMPIIGFPLGMLVYAVGYIVGGGVGSNVGAILGGLVGPLVWVVLTGGVVGSATGLLLRQLLRGRPERPLRVR